MKWGFLLLLWLSPPVFGWTLIAGDFQGWANRRLTIYVDPSQCGVDAAIVYDYVDTAIATWNQVPTADITLSRAPDAVSVTVAEFIAGTASHVPIILCDPDFAATNTVSADLIPALTNVSASVDNLDFGGILINAQVGGAAALGELTRSQATVTLAHEMGHVLGLGHSSSPQALMYYNISDKEKPVITADDRDGITYLYPRNEFTGHPFGCGAVHEGGSVERVGWALLFVALALLSGRVAMRPKMEAPSTKG